MASSDSVYLSDVLPAIQRELNAGRHVRIYPKGVSMEPMLRQGRDSVLLAATPPRLGKYDLPLCRRPNGQFVLHRVVAVHDGCYDLCGDNCFEIERGVPHDWIVAVADGFRRKGKDFSCESAVYRGYCRLWCAFRPIRRKLLRFRHLCGALKRKILGT